MRYPAPEPRYALLGWLALAGSIVLMVVLIGGAWTIAFHFIARFW